MTNTSFADFCRPLTAHLLETLKLDKYYYKAEGNYVFYKNNEGKDVKVLDFVGGYGANITGHNHPEITKTIINNIENLLPVNTQLSIRQKTGELAAILDAEIKSHTGENFIFTFSNTGTEAAEAAIKHALLTYSLKLADFIDEFEREALSVKTEFKKKHINVELIFNEIEYRSIEDFVGAIKNFNENTINERTPVFLALNKSFHGKTTGSLSLTSRKEYRLPFLGEDTNTKFLPAEINYFKEEFKNHDFELIIPGYSFDGSIKLIKQKFNSVAGTFIEPIQGEGGVNLISATFLKDLRSLTDKNNSALIFDEIQCGFFRTGELMASFKTGVVPDYYLIGKSLGGSFAKISALAVRKSKYKDLFGILHTSTFAEDDISAVVAMKSFEIAKSLSENIKTKGRYLLSKLADLKEKYPEVIADVRGEGLMCGIEFKNFKYSSSYGFQVLSRSGYLSYVLSGYLLNNFSIRISAVLSAEFTVRIQPSGLIEEKEIDSLYEALDKLCEILKKQDLYMLLEFLLSSEFKNIRSLPENFRENEVIMEDVPEGVEEAGFLLHYINAGKIEASDKSLQSLSDEEKERLLETIIDVASPTILGRKIFSDNKGKKLAVTFAGLPFTSKMCREAMLRNEADEYIRLCNDAVKLLKEEYNAKLVGLGQFTSVVTNNGKLINDSDIKLTTGNSFTVFMGLEAIMRKAKELNINISETNVAIIGAAGNISSVYAQCMTDFCSRIILFGSQSESGFQKALRTARNIYAEAVKNLIANNSIPSGNLENLILNTTTYKKIVSNPLMAGNLKTIAELESELKDIAPVQVSDNLQKLKDCKIVVAATSATEPFLKSEHFSENTVICDISVPINCTDELINNKKNIHIIFGGIVSLPGGEQIPALGFPLPKGNAYACISETILLGMENICNSYSFGQISKSQVYEIGGIAAKHNFKLGGMKNDILI